MGKISKYLQEMIDDLYTSDLIVKDDEGNVIYQHYNIKEVAHNDNETIQRSEFGIEKST